MSLKLIMVSTRFDLSILISKQHQGNYFEKCLDLKLNFGMSLKELHHKLSGQGLKILGLSVLLIYWAIILLGTFSLLN